MTGSEHSRKRTEFEATVAALLKVDPAGLSGKHRNEPVPGTEPVPPKPKAKKKAPPKK